MVGNFLQSQPGISDQRLQSHAPTFRIAQEREQLGVASDALDFGINLVKREVLRALGITGKRANTQANDAHRLHNFRSSVCAEKQSNRAGWVIISQRNSSQPRIAAGDL